MNTKTTYALLMRSEEKGRDLLETAAYTICVLSAVFAIGQFAQQPVKLMSDKSAKAHAAPQILQQVELAGDQKS